MTRTHIVPQFFEVGLKRPVKSEMVASIARSDKSRVYKIVIDGLTADEKQFLWRR